MTGFPERRLRLLDLCCKAGGASVGYHAAGFDVTGVDIEPQPDYPFRFIHADALTVDLSGYDVVAASPPCKRYCVATPTHRRDTHPDLVGPIRERLVEAVTSPGGPFAYVIENVPGAPLRDPVTICGDTLRLGVRRHRLFESNLPLTGTPCWHDRTAPPVPVYGSYGQRITRRRNHPVEGETSPGVERARAAMGIDWMPWPALTQAIPPAYTHWLGVQLQIHARDVSRSTAVPSAGGFRPHGGGVPSAETVGETSPTGGVQVASVTSDATPPAHPSPAGFRHCHCGRPLPARPVTGRWPRYCSQACRQAAYRARQLAKGAA
jgi:DNA (cytosine-5)-methyltransferase 1